MYGLCFYCSQEQKEKIYQKIPTFRLHFPGNIAVGEYHKDKWYRDAEWHEEVKELNYYLCAFY